MLWLYQIGSRILALFRKSKIDRELEDEITAHIEFATEENIRRGMDPNSAGRHARLKFGSRDAATELHRETRSLSLLEDLIKDLRHGARLLSRNPLFTLTAVLSLAIGIGADTTIFTIANALLLRAPSGVAEPARLVDIVGKHGPLNSISYPNYLDIRQRATSFDPYVFQPVAQSASLGSSSGAERVFVNFVSPNYFSVLGAHPRLGQFFAEDDGRRVESSPVVVLSHDFWKRRLKQNQSAIGQTLQLNGRAFTVIGVAPEGFQGTNIVGTDIWMPVGMVGVMQNPVIIVNRAMGWLMMGGRLKPGVSRTQAAAELDAITGALELEYPNENQGKSLRLTASSVIPNEVILPVSGFLSLLMAIVSLVLVIACANVASVLLARGAARRREIAVRLAIGAGRGRLLRQLSAETALLFLLGGAGGLLAARAMTSMLLSLLPALPVP